MLNKFLGWLYRRYPTRFQDLMVDDFVASLPDNVKEEAFTMMSSQKHRLNRLVDYLAYNLHRRMAKDPTNSQRYIGMFVQLKVMNSMILGRPETKHNPFIDPLKTEEKNKYEEHLAGAESFAEKIMEARKP